jgi:hypothetical protein
MECDLAFLAPHRITPESKFNDAWLVDCSLEDSEAHTQSSFSSVADEAFPIDQQPSVPPILRHFEADSADFRLQLLTAATPR